MQTRTKTILTILAFTVVGFLLNPNAPAGAALWGAIPEGAEAPTGTQVGLLVLVSLVESVALGLGAAFLLFGLPAVKRLGAGAGLTRAAWLAVAWGLVSWVPHSAMHATNGDDMARLILIEYVFHVTLVAAAALIAWTFVAGASARGRGAAARDVAAEARGA